jgi:hypothetical protein
MNSYFHSSTVFRTRGETFRILVAVMARAYVRGINKGRGYAETRFRLLASLGVLFVCLFQVRLSLSSQKGDSDFGRLLSLLD